MKVRHIEKGWTGVSGDFNTHGIGEMIVYFDGDGGASSEFCREYEIWIEAIQQWKSWRAAIRDHDIIVDNYNTTFFEPRTEEDRQRGFTL